MGTLSEMMKAFLISILVVWSVSAAPQQINNPTAKILTYHNDNDGLGNYKFEYETENGISYAEEGKLKHIENENEAIVKTGSYKYTGLNSETINIAYTADENGYKAKVNIRLLPPSPSIVIQASPALLASLVGR